jgi:hypothetical protein
MSASTAAVEVPTHRPRGNARGNASQKVASWRRGATSRESRGNKNPDGRARRDGYGMPEPAQRPRFWIGRTYARYPSIGR